MSVQVLGLRSYYSEKHGKTMLKEWDSGARAKSVADLFARYGAILDKIPQDERYNLYYTIHHCPPRKPGETRKFTEQRAMPYDIDGIDRERWREYIPIIAEALCVKVEESGVIFSGNGVQFIIGLSNPIKSEAYFDSYRPHYRATCNKINDLLAANGLPGSADNKVFSPKRLMRMPGTLNRKKDKGERMGEVLNTNIVAVDFDITVISGIPIVDEGSQITPETLKKFPAADTKAVLSECEFLKHCKEKPTEIDEATWYAMLSVTGRLQDGIKISHEYSEGHPGYSHGETETKLEQALGASGPRTCKNINDLWGNCKSCKHFENMNSPIMIRGADFIATKDSGFHSIRVNSQGRTVTGKPCYKDLEKFFFQKNPYVVMGESEQCLIFNGTHWEEYKDLYLKNYAQKMFSPFADTKMVNEFSNLVCRFRPRPTEWFVKTTSGKINFQNGYLDLKTMELKPHSKEVGFRYVLPYAYDPSAICERFDKFMGEITCGDPDLEKILLEFAGYSFSSDECWADKALIMTGEGSNGKSTFMNVMRALAGKENYSSLTLIDLKNEANRYHLDGRLFNLAEETPTYSIAESSLFKNLCTGGEIMVKILYKQSYSIKNKTKLMLACNELPKTDDTTKGFFRRLLIVPFNQTFDGTGKDSFIFDKLVLELPGIFNKVIAGYHRLRKQKCFSESVSAARAIEDYRDELDTVHNWFKYNVVVHNRGNGTYKAQVDKLYSAYRYYSEADSEKAVVKNTFCKRLRRLIPQYDLRHKREIVDKKRQSVLYGIQFGDESQY